METRTPRSLGYRWPAEWEPHAATWLSWPRNPETWPGAFDEAVDEYVSLVETIGRFERVNVLAGGEQMKVADSRIGHLSNVILHDVPTNDAWIRDHGPTFLTKKDQRQSETALIDWQYNAWGNKYPPFDFDNDVPEQIAKIENAESKGIRFTQPIVLEGGSIEGNGAGTLLTTESCVLNKNRNPELTRDEFQQIARNYLNCENVIWLTGEIAGDDTDGHIDQIARFVDEKTVLTCRDPENKSLAGNRQKILKASETFGLELEVVDLPMPAPMKFNGQSLPASYANFYFVNGAVIVPVYGDPKDEQAIEIMTRHCPSREIIRLSARYLVIGLGSFHCLTQQQCR